MQLNEREWAIFFIGDVFLTDKLGKQCPTGSNIPNNELSFGIIPRVTVTSLNNGIGLYSSEHKNYRAFSNFVSVSFLATIFYHRYKASFSVHDKKLF